MKFCPRCRTHLPLSAFAKDRTRKDGLQPYCRTCKSQVQKGVRREALNGTPLSPMEEHERTTEEVNWYRKNVPYVREFLVMELGPHPIFDADYISAERQAAVKDSYAQEDNDETPAPTKWTMPTSRQFTPEEKEVLARQAMGLPPLDEQATDASKDTGDGSS